MMTGRRYLMIVLLCCSFSMVAEAQKVQYTDAKKLTLYGKANASGPYYHRVDTMKYSDMPGAVKHLSTHPSGFAIAFKTNSHEIHARWSTKGDVPRGNMPAVASRGVDLYIKRNGEWIFAGAGVPQDSISTRRLVANMADGEKECLLFLPLYAELLSLEIGVEPGSALEPLSIPWRKKVVIYGSSITQGASASRPGLSYPAVMSRRLGYEFVNLGFSGSGKMEEAVGRMVADVQGADLIILDCAANPTPEQIEERTEAFVKQIRERHPRVPILMIQSVVREGGNFDQTIRDRVANQNKNFEAAYKRLVKGGMKQLHFIHGTDLLGHDHEGTVDGTHPNDLGFDRMIKVIEPKVKEILK